MNHVLNRGLKTRISGATKKANVRVKVKRPIISDSDLLDLVECEIAARRDKDGFSFQVSREAVEHAQNNRRYITVFPEPSDMRIARYSEALGEVEDRIRKQTKINLLLVPAIPD